MGDFGEKIAAGVAAIFTVAIIALVLSMQANTTNVLSAFFAGLSNLVGVAISPVTGQSISGLSGNGLTGGNWAGFAMPIGGNSTGGILGGAGSLLGGLGNLLGGSGAGGGLSSLLGGGGSSSGGLGSLLGGSGGGLIDSGSWD